MAREKRMIDAMDTVTKISKAVTPLIKAGVSDEWVCQKIYDKVLNCIAEAHTVDAVEVVRCKYCKHRDEYGDCTPPIISAYGYDHLSPKDDDFCSYGERREGV